MKANRSFRFTHTISRTPGKSCARGLRFNGQSDPDPDEFVAQHLTYIDVLKQAGVTPILLPALEAFPDSVFVEDAALCIGDHSILLRPGSPTRFGEAAAIEPDLNAVFATTTVLDGDGSVDGGDILLTDDVAFIGLSERTSTAGAESLRPLLEAHHYSVEIVNTPPGVLHFKSDCSLLDSGTILATRRLAASGCFSRYRVIEAPTGEEEAVNLIRVNDMVIMRSGFPLTEAKLSDNGYQIVTINSDEAAKLDGGLSCMSLRFNLNE